MRDQLIALAGALMVLAAYFAYQRGWMGREDRWYNALNFAGSSLLTWVALVDRRWGFVLLEAVWAVLSLPGMIKRTPARPGPSEPPARAP